MPWNKDTFRKHNKHLSDAQAKKASSIANALLKAGHSDASSIRIANSMIKHLGHSRMSQKMYGDKK